MNTKERLINVSFTISQESHDNGWTMPFAHYHNDYEIYILRSGKRIVTIGENEYITETYDAALFSSTIPHKSRGEEAFSGICIHFSENYVNRYLSKLAKTLLISCFNKNIIHLSEAEFNEIAYYADNFKLENSSNFVVLINILNILNSSKSIKKSNNMNYQNNSCYKNDIESACHLNNVEKVNYIKKADNSLIRESEEVNQAENREINQDADKCNTEGYIESDVVPDNTDSKATMIISYVNENYTFINNIKVLTEYFKVSESYIFRIFRQKFKVTPKHYINKLRLDNACRCMRGKRTIKDISEECGFVSYEYFIRIFKKEYGCTPTEYRKRIAEKD